MAPAWKSLLHTENKRLTLRNIRTLCLIGMTMVPACTILDKFAYPQLWWEFFLIRAIAAVLMIAILLLSYTDLGFRHYRLLVLLVPLVPLLTIASMIWRSGEPGSSYYAGLCLVLVGFGFLFQWSFTESLIAVGVTMLLYLGATVPHLPPHPLKTAEFGQFVNNTMFLLLNSIIITTGSLVHQRIRENEVISRYRLADSRKELEEKNQQLVEMDRLKTDFFSNVTHELRTPLTLMLAPLQRLLRLTAGTASPGGADVNSEISGIYQNGLRLLRLINDLLNLSSVDAGRLSIESREFSLTPLLERITRSIGTIAGQGGVTLVQDLRSPLETLRGDEEKLEKILLNLLFNAVKFTPAGGRITLGVEERDGELIFEVSDTGVGIPSKSLPFIFDRFWQADTSSTRRHTGTGLGLSLVKEFTQAMGGRVTAESTVGAGTTIRIHLPSPRENGVPMLGIDPAAAAEGARPSAPPAEKEPNSGSAAWIRAIYREAEQSCAAIPETTHRPQPAKPAPENPSALPLVLIADDEPGMLRFMRSELEPHYRIIEAADGAAALKMTLEQKPDLVIADYMMPNLDGLALCGELCRQDSRRRIPIMLVTARGDEEVRLTALRHGANDVLVKPFSLSEFNSRVHNLIQNHLLQKEIENRNTELERTIGELRAAERELIQSEKMAALGILTGGIMHEINNPLNFARSALYILDRRAAKLPGETAGEIGAVVADLREGISRISTIVSELRTFCHPETVMASVCPLSEPLQSAARLLAAPLRESSICLEDQVPETLTVRGDKNQLTLVFLNLLKNALDALATSSSGSATPRQISVSARAQGPDLVEVSVADNGPGIPAEHLSHVFDPFFTTKAPGEGTGLGLSICYRIIAAHGGAITANSQPGKGTQFTIRLSRVSSPPVSPALPALSA